MNKITQVLRLVRDGAKESGTRVGVFNVRRWLIKLYAKGGRLSLTLIAQVFIELRANV